MANPSLQANFSAGTAGFTQGMSEMRQKLLELNTNMEQTRQAIRNANTEVREYQKELNALRAATNNGSTATGEQRQRMQELRDRIAQTTAQIGTLRTAEQDLRSQIRNANSDLQSQRSALENVSSSAATMGDVLKANLYSSAIQGAVSKLIQSLKTAAEYCYNVGSSFEAAMSQVEAISGAVGSELDSLTEKAKTLGETTRFSATEAASAMNYMAMAGWDAQQMLDGIDGVMSLAAASGADLAETTDIVTDAITAFGLAAEDVGHFSDVLAAASSNANTNVSMMGETFKYCAPIAGALGFSIEDVSEAIGLMANSGIKSTMAGTALRTTLTRLSEGVTLSGKAFGEITIQTSNADGSMRSLNDILDEMRGAFSQLTESEKAAAAESVAGKNAMSGFLALMNAGEGDVNKLRSAIENCTGASADMADTMTNNTAGAVTIMKSALEGLGIAVYDSFGDKLKTSVEGVTEILSDLTDKIKSGSLDETFDRLAESVGGAAEQIIDFAGTALPDFIGGLADVISFVVEYRNVIAGAAAAMITFKGAMAIGNTFVMLKSSISGVVTAVKSATTATQALTTAQAANNAVAAANPYVAVAAAVLALVGGIATLISTTDEATDKVEELNSKTKELNQTASDSRKVADDVEKLVEEYKELSSSVGDTEGAKQRLKEIQDILVNSYGAEADNLDLVNGKYEEQLGLLTQIADKKDSDAKRDAVLAYNNYVEQEKAERDTVYSDSSGDMDGFLTYSHIAMALRDSRVREIFENLAKTNDSISVEKNIMSTGGYDDYTVSVSGGTTEKYEAYKAIIEAFEKSGLDDVGGDISKYYKDYVDSYNKYKELYEANRTVLGNYFAVTNESVYGNTKAFNDYYYGNGAEVGGKPHLLGTQAQADYYRNLYGGGGAADASGTAGMSAEELEKQYDSEKELLKWRLDMGIITEEEYYSQLAALRDKYLDESSAKWRAATLEIHKYQVSQNGNALDDIKQQYSDAVSAIDDEIKQHNRDREDEDINEKIADVEKQLKYGRLDEYSRMQLEQKRQELLDEKTETEWKRQKEDEKEMLGTVYTLAKEAYDQGTADLNSALQTASAVFSAIGTGAQQTASTVSTVNNNSVSMIMNAVSQTSDQIAAAVIRALSSDI